MKQKLFNMHTSQIFLCWPSYLEQLNIIPI